MTALRELKTNETAQGVEVIWEISQSGIQQALYSSQGFTLRGQTAEDSLGSFRFGVRSEARIVLRESWTTVMRAYGAGGGGGGTALHIGKVD